ncbi:PAS domain-containing protein [Phenylobacterium sp.]|uniref:sensor histidine kinase n=1 Tax=Phenylobacterium sp. TaxID=1871053 RepID=UPI0025EA468C|nr:PAS domain-containing protein [Phenylobacterium sp.]
MLDSFGDGFIAFDFQWRVTHCNGGGADRYGLRREDMLGRMAWDLPGMGEDQVMHGFLERALATGASIEAEVRSELRGGRWFYLRAFPLEGGLGVSSRDVTERHEQTRRERDQAERLELALATAGFGDWRWDPVTDLVDLSHRAAEIIGVPPGANTTWTEQLKHLHPDDRDAAQEAVRKAIAERTFYEIEYRFFRLADGAERWMMVRARAQYAEDGTPTGMLGVLTDITDARLERDRIRADRARLAESEARFRAMADSAPAPVWVTDSTGALVFANRAFCELAAMPLDRMFGDGWIEIMHPEDRPRIAAARAENRHHRQPLSWEARFWLSPGEWRWLRTASQPRFDEAGELQGYVGLAMDTTDTHRAEERQQLLINELNHRVKNTLATIQSLARQTLREGVEVREGRERLTDRLLALSAAHNVLTRENWEGADLGELAHEAVRPYDDPAAPRIAAEGPPVRLAPNVALALSMALHELATNAVKYGALSAPEGRVALAWTLNPAGDGIDLTWRETGGPPVVVPLATGFGSRLLAGLGGELSAPAAMTYAATGVVCRLRAPVA